MAEDRLSVLFIPQLVRGASTATIAKGLLRAGVGRGHLIDVVSLNGMLDDWDRYGVRPVRIDVPSHAPTKKMSAQDMWLSAASPGTYGWVASPIDGGDYDVIVTQPSFFAHWLRMAEDLIDHMGETRYVFVRKARVIVVAPVYPFTTQLRARRVGEVMARQELFGYLAGNLTIMESDVVIHDLQREAGRWVDRAVVDAIQQRLVRVHNGVELGKLPHGYRDAPAMTLQLTGYPYAGNMPAWVSRTLSDYGIRYGGVTGTYLAGQSTSNPLSQQYPGIAWNDRLSWEEYLQRMTTVTLYAGNSIDEAYCLRLWEAVWMGCLPLVMRGSVEAMLPDGYPLVYADGQELLSMLLMLRHGDNLRRAYARWMPVLQELVRREHDAAVCRANYWQLIEGLVAEHVAAFSSGLDEIDVRVLEGAELCGPELQRAVSAATRSGLRITPQARGSAVAAAAWPYLARKLGFRRVDRDRWERVAC